MKTLLLILLPILSFCQQPNFIKVIEQHDDAEHVYAEVFIVMGSSEILYHYNHNVAKSILIAIPIGMTIGAGKEFIWDRAMKRGVFSKMDLFYDAWGILLGTIGEIVFMDVRGRNNYDQDYYDSQIRVRKKRNKWSLKINGFKN